jgi:hypothetical protein
MISYLFSLDTDFAIAQGELVKCEFYNRKPTERKELGVVLSVISYKARYKAQPSAAYVFFVVLTRQCVEVTHVKNKRVSRCEQFEEFMKHQEKLGWSFSRGN